MTTKKRDEPAAKCTITEALCTPRPTTDVRKSAEVKVQQFLPAIAKARQLGKTWIEITKILNQEEPRFHPDSLERAARKLLRAKNAESAKPPTAGREAKPGRPAHPGFEANCVDPSAAQSTALQPSASKPGPLLSNADDPWKLTDNYNG